MRSEFVAQREDPEDEIWRQCERAWAAWLEEQKWDVDLVPPYREDGSDGAPLEFLRDGRQVRRPGTSAPPKVTRLNGGKSNPGQEPTSTCLRGRGSSGSKRTPLMTTAICTETAASAFSSS